MSHRCQDPFANAAPARGRCSRRSSFLHAHDRPRSMPPGQTTSATRRRSRTSSSATRGGLVWVTSGALAAYSWHASATSGRALNWIRTRTTPAISQNLFRLRTAASRYGQSWLKHGFTALSEAVLERVLQHRRRSRVTARPYSSSLNGRRVAGPKYQVNPFAACSPIPSRPARQQRHSCTRLRSAPPTRSCPNPSSLYFVEAQYITEDDAAAKNQNDNAPTDVR